MGSSKSTVQPRVKPLVERTAETVGTVECDDMEDETKANNVRAWNRASCVEAVTNSQG